MNFKESFTYDDILLEPRLFLGASRNSIKLDTEICNKKLTLPIIAAPMTSVVNYHTAEKMEQSGGMAIFDRFSEYLVENCIQFKCQYGYTILPVGLMDYKALYKLIDYVEPDCVLIEVAHAHQRQVIDQVCGIKQEYPSLKVMVGNIATTEAAFDLVTAGADCLKIGIGPGWACKTRSVSGCGVPQGSAIMEIYNFIKDINYQRRILYQSQIELIADGGIRNSGDIVKALALGADAVMVGSLYAAASDSPAKTIITNGKAYKQYYGMASDESQSQRGVSRAAEGVSGEISATNTIKEISQELKEGIQSGLSYLGFESLKELKQNRHKIVARKLTQGALRENGTI